MADKNTLLWHSYPPTVQTLLNLVQVYVSARDTMDETLAGDVVKLRHYQNRDINAVIDRVGQAERDLREAVREYQKAGGNAIAKDSKGE